MAAQAAGHPTALRLAAVWSAAKAGKGLWALAAAAAVDASQAALPVPVGAAATAKW